MLFRSIKQYQHLVESDDAVMTSCEEEIQKLESQIQDTDANLEAIMSADSDAQKGRDDYDVANTAWEEYRAASDEILKLSREGKQQEAAKLMTGEVYEEYTSFAEKLTTLRKPTLSQKIKNKIRKKIRKLKALGKYDYGDYLLRKSISGTALAYAGNWRCTGIFLPASCEV